MRVAIGFILGFGAAFALMQYWPSTIPAPSVSTPSPAGPTIDPHFGESVAGTMATAITQRIAGYYEYSGHFPPVANFWKAIDMRPLHNPLNGHADVVAMKVDRDWDTSGVGWVYDETTGAIYPGTVFNSARSTTRPETER